MMKTRIFFTTNAGLYFSSGRSELLIDGIHKAEAVGFSKMPGEMKRQMRTSRGLFVGSGTLLFTHLHKDHYDATRVRLYLERHPETGLWGPELNARGITDYEEVGDTCRFNCGDFAVTAYSTRHSGTEGEACSHYSFLLRGRQTGETFFISGDAVFDPALTDEVKKDTAGSVNGTMAFVTAYQLIEQPSRDFLTRLAPARLVLIHQPQEDDPASRIVGGLMEFARKYPPSGIRIEEPEPMNWIK